MASFAEIDTNNVVIRVVVVPDEEEHRGNEYLSIDLNLGGRWVQTSYNTINGEHVLGSVPIRFTFAGIGYYYNEEKDIFQFPNGKYIVSMNEEGFCTSEINPEWSEENL